eukprot:502223-Prorocentrum_minimum.AAC.2
MAMFFVSPKSTIFATGSYPSGNPFFPVIFFMPPCSSHTCGAWGDAGRRVDTREPQNPTTSEAYRKHRQGVLYGTRGAREGNRVQNASYNRCEHPGFPGARGTWGRAVANKAGTVKSSRSIEAASTSVVYRDGGRACRFEALVSEWEYSHSIRSRWPSGRHILDREALVGRRATHLQHHVAALEVAVEQLHPVQMANSPQDVNGPPLHHRERRRTAQRNLILQGPPADVLHDDKIGHHGQVGPNHLDHILANRPVTYPPASE